MRIVVCGSRDWTDRETIRWALSRLPLMMAEDELAHGAARGADSIAGEEAKRLGWVVRPYPADWDAHKPSPGRKNPAGAIRNRHMLDDFRPELVLAFTDSIVRGDGRARRLTGTGDCIAAAIERGIRVSVIPSRRKL